MRIFTTDDESRDAQERHLYMHRSSVKEKDSLGVRKHILPQERKTRDHKSIASSTRKRREALCQKTENEKGPSLGEGSAGFLKIW